MDRKPKKCPANILLDGNGKVVAYEAWSYQDGFRRLEYSFWWFDETIQPRRFTTTVNIPAPGPMSGRQEARRRRDLWIKKHGRIPPAG